MNGGLVVDTSALLAILFAEDDAHDYAQALGEAAAVSIAAPIWVESMMVVTARRGEIGRVGLEELLAGLEVETVPCDAEMARCAYDAWARFGKGRHPAGLNFADCFSYALARLRGEPLLFKGRDFSLTDIPSAMSARSR